MRKSLKCQQQQQHMLLLLNISNSRPSSIDIYASSFLTSSNIGLSIELTQMGSNGLNGPTGKNVFQLPIIPSQKIQNVDKCFCLNVAETLQVCTSTHRDHRIHIKKAWVRQNTSTNLLHDGFTRFSQTARVFFDVYLKRSSFWPSADVKPTSNYLVHAMPMQCMHALSICMLQ